MKKVIALILLTAVATLVFPQNDCNQPLSTQQFQQRYQQIKNESYNSAKLQAAKYIIETKKCLSAIQLKGIVELFSYENSRLEIAMHGYDFTKNKDDYYMIVSEALGFENSKRKLLNYINNQR